MEVNLEVIINKLEYKVNELTLRNQKLEKLGAIKDRLEATYRCELRKELLRLSINSTKISIIDDIEGDNANLTQLRLNRDLAEIRYYSMKSSIENIKFEIEVLRSLLTWLSDELECLKLKVKMKSWLN
ncbi:hypothetical protein [Clostridium sp.]|uniref:hypothetical protein n=1 Tax=Clostridium sp. TaxID=1506 RepID=UPI003F806EC3